MPSSNKYIIVVLGPTGAGKTTLAEETIKILEEDGRSRRSRRSRREKTKRRLKNYTKILVDDLVENSRVYKRKVLEILNTNNIDINTSKEDMINLFKDKNIVNLFSNAYFETRKKIGGCEEDISKSCDQINDEKLNKAIRDGKKYIVIESTGEYIPAWLKCIEVENIRKHNYKIIYSYVGVKVTDLVERNLNRAYSSTIKFLDDVDEPAPRIPDTDLLRSKVLKIFSTLLELFELCVTNNNRSVCKYNCGGEESYFNISSIFRLYFFDNNVKKGETMKLIYSKDEYSTTYTNSELFKKVIDIFF